MTMVNRFIMVLYLLITESNIKISGCAHRMVYANGHYSNTCNGGYINENNVCVSCVLPQCPAGYFLMNGLCYIRNSNYCFTEYYYLNGNCYPTVAPTCEYPPSELKPTIEGRILPSTSIIRCPLGSVLTKNECRKIICSIGEYYQGQCLQPVCPKGTVWRGRRCQEQSYITTVLKIENALINKARDGPGAIIQQNVNNYVTPKPSIIVSTNRTVGPAKTTSQILISPPRSNTPPIGICCTIFTPRICKLYDKKWVCFNRQLKRCDTELCSHPKIYLRVPEPIYDPPILVMPPYPSLGVCPTPDCENADNVDCSGCKSYRREKCSFYCYHYLCPVEQCAFVDLKEYCIRHPGEFGCAKSDGCLWDWCRAKKCSK